MVALLKELGVKAQLSIAIEGESLLNDGSAMVLWTVRAAPCDRSLRFALPVLFLPAPRPPPPPPVLPPASLLPRKMWNSLRPCLPQLLPHELLPLQYLRARPACGWRWRRPRRGWARAP